MCVSIDEFWYYRESEGLFGTGFVIFQKPMKQVEGAEWGSTLLLRSFGGSLCKWGDLDRANTSVRQFRVPVGSSFF